MSSPDNQDPSQQKGSPKALEVEILPPGDEESAYGGYSRQARSDEQCGQRAYPPYGASWTLATFNNPGCMTASITFGVFLITLFQYGLLAAIGFFVFHIIGSIIIAIQASKALMAGRPFAAWPARWLNWILCYLLIVWLSGGFPD